MKNASDLILPNLHGLLLVVAVASVLGTLALLLLPGQALVYRLLMLAGLSLVMCGVWILTILLSGMKRYKAITVLFGSAYVIIVAASLLMRPGVWPDCSAASCWATWCCSWACGCSSCANSIPKAA